jgi:hypothetical protein
MYTGKEGVPNATDEFKIVQGIMTIRTGEIHASQPKRASSRNRKQHPKSDRMRTQILTRRGKENHTILACNEANNGGTGGAEGVWYHYNA